MKRRDFLGTMCAAPVVGLMAAKHSDLCIEHIKIRSSSKRNSSSLWMHDGDNEHIIPLYNADKSVQQELDHNIQWFRDENNLQKYVYFIDAGDKHGFMTSEVKLKVMPDEINYLINSQDMRHGDTGIIIAGNKSEKFTDGLTVKRVHKSLVHNKPYNDGRLFFLNITKMFFLQTLNTKKYFGQMELKK